MRTYTVAEYISAINGPDQCPYDEMLKVLEPSEVTNLIEVMHSENIKAHPSGVALITAMKRGLSRAVSDLIRLKICDPLTARGTFLITVMHAAAYSGSQGCLEEAVRHAPSLVCVKNAAGNTPFDTAVGKNNVASARFLLQHGASVQRGLVTEVSNLSGTLDSLLFDEEGELEMAKLLVAHGDRIDPEEAEELLEVQKRYLDLLFSRLRACGRAAVIVMGLNRVGCKTQGNGRDALRLVARMVWVYRVDEVWDEF